MKNFFTWLWRSLAFLVFFAFALQNTEKVNLVWFSNSWQAPLILVLSIFLGLGLLLGFLLAFFARRQRRDLRTSPLHNNSKTVNK